VCGLKLGSTAVTAPSTMVNLVGGVPPLAELAAIEGAHVHLYGKSPRPGRKLGHVTITGGREWRRVAELAELSGDG
jgi:5-(carboxyamino)imidazole ribonucleotide synthase